MKTDTEDCNTTMVILVYGHGGRAAKMRLVESRPREITARNPTTGAVIDLSRDIIYEDDAALFAQLTTAWEEGRQDVLAALWSRAKKYED